MDVLIDKIDDNFYYEENVQYIRVTRILNCFPKPALYNWYATHGLKECRRIQKESREFGTNMHTKIHANLDGALAEQMPDMNDARMIGTMKEFMSWKTKNKPVPIHLEYSIVNKEDMYGGTIDFIGTINGVKTIADWKSSGGIYDDYPLQLAAYHRAYKLMHPDEEPIKEGRIVCFRCDKDGKCKTIEETYSVARLEDLYSVFLAVKKTYEYKYGVK